MRLLVPLSTKEKEKAMYKDISSLKKELKRMKYSTITPSNEDLIAARVAKLKEDEDFSEWDDASLERYVKMGIVNQFNSGATKLKSRLTSSTRPDYPEWNSFTYQEILQMKEAGESIPADLVEWANSMANSDIVSYEIDTESISDTAALGAIDTAANANGSVLETKKVLQKLTSKESTQERLLEEKNEELQTSREIASQQQEQLQTEQNATLAKINDLQKEFKRLDSKVQSGGTLSEDEIIRYQELSGLLSVQGKQLQVQTKNMEAQIKSLLSEIEIVSEVVDVNNALAQNSERTQRTYSASEAYRRGSFYASNNSGLGVSGDTSMLYYSAMTSSLSATSGSIDLGLNLAATTTANTLNRNQSLAKLINTKVVDVENRFNITNISSVSPEVIAYSQNTPTTPQENVSTAQTTDTTADTVNGEPQTDAVNEGENTTDTTAIADATVTVDTQNQEELKIKELVDGSTQQTADLGTYDTGFAALKTQVNGIIATAEQDSKKFEKDYKSKVSEYQKLLTKLQNSNGSPKDDTLPEFLRKDTTFTQNDMAKYNTLRSELDTETGTFANRLNAKLEILGNFISSYQSGFTMTESAMEYGTQAISQGKMYALSQTGYTEADFYMLCGFYGMSPDEAKNVIYGKSGESVGRDAMDAGEELVASASNTQNILNSSVAVNDNSLALSDELSARKGAMSAEISGINAQFDETFAQKDAEEAANAQEENPTDQTNDKEKTKENEPDAAAVEQQGAQAKQSAKEADKEGKNAEKDEAAYKAQQKRNENLLRRYQKQIKEETKKIDTANAQIEAGNAQAQTYASVVSGLSAQMQTNNNKQVSTNNTATATNNAATINTYVGQINQITETNTNLGQVVTSGGQTISVLQKKSTKTQKVIERVSKAKYTAAVKKQKESEQEAKDKQKPIQTVTKIGYVFTGIKMVGLGLMAIPFTHAIGQVMYGVGTYGEIACYATNTALNAAQGNWLGAAICVGAAAVSFFAGPNPTKMLSEGIEKLGTTAAKKAAEQAATTATTGIAEAGVPNTVEQAGTEAAKAGVTNTVEQAATSAISQEALTAMNETLQQTSKNIIEQATKEAAKQALTEKVVQTGLTVGGGVVQQVGNKLATAQNQEEEKKTTGAVRGRQKAREALQKALQTVKRKKKPQNAK